MSKSEAQIVEETQAAIAAGADPFGDHEDDAPDDVSNASYTGAGDKAADKGTEAEDSQTPTDETTPSKTEEELSEAQLNAIANEPEEQADPLNVLNFNAEMPADYKTARATLQAQEAEALKKLMGGEIDTDEYAAIKLKVSDGLEELMAQRIRAETLQDASAQSNAQFQLNAIKGLIERAKDEVPYATDANAQRQFDMALTNIKADPEFADKSFTTVVNEAHRVVKALRGVLTSAADTSAKSKEELAAIADGRKPKDSALKTLRSLPAAATANTGGSVIDSLAQLKGQQYEAAFAKLTPAQRASMLDE